MLSFRSFHLLTFFLILFGVRSEYVFATVSGVTFTPATTLYFHWSNGSVNFDVAPFFDYDVNATEKPGSLDTDTAQLSGTFYASGIGWIQFSTGSYQVRIHCNQSFQSQTNSCMFTGTGWSDTVGEIDFTNLTYSSTGGTLSGFIHSFLGDISLDGIFLPLRPAHFIDESEPVIAQSDYTFTIANKSTYGSWNWSLYVCLPSDISCKLIPDRNVHASWTMDISPGDYLYEIIDPQGSKTTGTLTITEGSIDPEKTVYSGNLITSKPTPSIYANGKDEYTLEIQFKDKNGNAVNIHSMKFFVQLAWENASVGIARNQLVDNDIPVSPSIYNHDLWLPTNALNVTWSISTLNPSTIITNEWFTISTDTDSLFLKFSSVAPSEKLHFEKLEYVFAWMTGKLLGTFRDENLPFLPAITVSTQQPNSIEEWRRLVLTGIVNQKNIGNIGNIRTIHGLSLWDINSPDSYIDFQSPLTTSEIICSIEQSNNYSTPHECAFSSLSGITNPSIVAFAGTGVFPFSWTGTVSGSIVNYTPVIAYNVAGDASDTPPVVYYGASWSALAQEYTIPPIDPLSIIGGKSLSIDGSSDVNGFFQRVHRTVTTLLRNGIPPGSKLHFTPDDVTVTGSTLSSNLLSVVTVGGNITITGNIINGGDQPYALVALQDSEGQGGEIHIHTGVTDIHATLVAERGILGNGTSSWQLYILGSLISRNTLSGSLVSPLQCPYFISKSECDWPNAEKYDLWKLRLFPPNPDFLSQSKSQAYRDNSGSSLIIEYDPRIITNPPPGLE